MFSIPRPEESEDCLYLNVFAPKKTKKRFNRKTRYPVLFWIYGGGFNFGNAGQPIYDGSHFAALEDVIVVSVNYRTNVFGFPIAPDITNLTERNLGLLDQRAGLDWVQRNIEVFGGDPERVTIFGQSAGAYAVDVLLTAPWPNGPPFRAGIMESGTYSYNPLPNCNDTNFASWNNFVQRLQCENATSTFNCVMGKSASDIRYVQENFNIGFGMAGDNITIVCDPRLRREAGKFARVPVIGGTNLDEGSYYAAKNGTDIDRYFKTYFPNETVLKEQILTAYKLDPTEGRFDNHSILSQIHTDWNYHCVSNSQGVNYSRDTERMDSQPSSLAIAPNAMSQPIAISSTRLFRTSFSRTCPMIDGQSLSKEHTILLRFPLCSRRITAPTRQRNKNGLVIRCVQHGRTSLGIHRSHP